MTIATVSAKGAVYIPRELRERYGLRKGAKVHVIAYGGVLTIVPALRDPIHQTRGMFAVGSSLTEALLKARAEDAATEERRAPPA